MIHQPLWSVIPSLRAWLPLDLFFSSSLLLCHFQVFGNISLCIWYRLTKWPGQKRHTPSANATSIGCSAYMYIRKLKWTTYTYLGIAFILTIDINFFGIVHQGPSNCCLIFVSKSRKLVHKNGIFLCPSQTFLVWTWCFFRMFLCQTGGAVKVVSFNNILLRQQQKNSKKNNNTLNSM